MTGVRHGDNAPFDADGPGTSDLDLTLVGAEAVAFYRLTGFFIPKIHSRPVSEDDPDIAPDLLPLRERLMKVVGRPVNIQGTRDWIMFEVVEQLAAATEMPFWASNQGHSVGFMSRVRVRHEWHRPPASRRAFLEIVPEGEPFRIFGVHLSAVHSNWTEKRRVRELRAVLAGIAEHQHGFHVVTGDFNTIAPGETLDLGTARPS